MYNYLYEQIQAAGLTPEEVSQQISASLGPVNGSINTINSSIDTIETKLGTIENGAEVNVNPDWTATSGDASILNRPTLGTAAAKNISTGIATGSTSDDLPTAKAVAKFVEDKGYTTNTGTVTKVTAGTGLNGGDITTTGTISLAESGATAGRYGQTSNVSVNLNADAQTVSVPDISVDAYGRVTAISNKTLTLKNTDTTYTKGALSDLNTGTETSGKLWDASTISQYVS